MRRMNHMHAWCINCAWTMHTHMRALLAISNVLLKLCSHAFKSQLRQDKASIPAFPLTRRILRLWCCRGASNAEIPVPSKLEKPNMLRVRWSEDALCVQQLPLHGYSFATYIKEQKTSHDKCLGKTEAGIALWGAKTLAQKPQLHASISDSISLLCWHIGFKPST
jgi:hypothetical protein